jgi:hypothetical protein
VHVSKASLPRALRILDAFVKALEQRGFRMVTALGQDRRPAVEVLGEYIEISLQETARRIPHVPTAQEREDQNKFSWSRPKPWDYEPSGILALTIQEHTMHPVRKTWADGKRYRVEDLVGHAVAGIVLVAQAVKLDRLERERQQEEWRRAEERRLEEQRRRQEEEERRRDLHRKAERWAISHQLRDYLAAVERAAAGAGHTASPAEPIQRWLRWAHSYVDALDPLQNNFPSQVIG